MNSILRIGPRKRIGLALALAVVLPVVLEYVPAPLACGQEVVEQIGPAASSTITVELVSGRTFTAEIDGRTDAAQLWLRWQQTGGELLRPIRWDCVVRARVGGEDMSGEQFHALVRRLRSEVPAEPETPTPRNTIVMIGAPAPPRPVIAPAGPAGAAPTPRVTSLAFDAMVGRWDENVEADGLVLHVYPLDAQGAIVPVRGTIEVDLTAEQIGPVLLPHPFIAAGHWAQEVRPEDFGPAGAVYRLRFQAVHPEFSRVAPRGAVHACLTVPGQGTFQSTASTAPIRPFSPVRNQLQQLTGQRFFPNERTDDGRH